MNNGITGVKRAFLAAQTRIGAGITNIITKHERLAEFAVNNAPLLVVAAAAFPLAGIPMVMGICYTKPTRLAEMINDKGLPGTITTDIISARRVGFV